MRVYFRSEKNNRIGYINKLGQVVFEPIFDSSCRYNIMHEGFSNGYKWEKKNDKWGIIDNKGNITCDFIFESPGWQFDVNHISPMVIDGNLYFIHPDGKKEKRDGIAGGQVFESVYIIKKTSGWGFQNYNGNNLFFDAVFDNIYGFDEGVCIVQYKGNYGIVNKAGKYIDLRRLRIEHINRFNSGRADFTTKIDNRLLKGFIDFNGDQVIEPIFDEFGSHGFFHGLAKVEIHKPGSGLAWNLRTSSGYIDTNGNIICDYYV